MPLATDEHLGGFHMATIMSKAVMNHGSAGYLMISSPLDVCLEEELLGHMITLF